jgi:hypothetical protein
MPAIGQGIPRLCLAGRGRTDSLPVQHEYLEEGY